MDEDQPIEWEDAIPSQTEDKYDLLEKLVNPDFEYYDDKAKLLALPYPKFSFESIHSTFLYFE